MKSKFSHNFKLPDYLEEALAPFSWSGVFSDDFRNSIINIIMAVDPVDAANRFSEALMTLNFLDGNYKLKLISAAKRYAQERQEKKNEDKRVRG